MKKIIISLLVCLGILLSSSFAVSFETVLAKQSLNHYEDSLTTTKHVGSNDFGNLGNVVSVRNGNHVTCESTKCVASSINFDKYQKKIYDDKAVYSFSSRFRLK